MMQKPIDNVFNYISKAVRKAEGDDDQLISWALQAWKRLNQTREMFVKNLILLEVQNHRTALPPDLKRIQSIRIYNRGTGGWEELCPDPPEDAFDTPCNIYVQNFLDSGFYRDNWNIVKRIPNLTAEYLCTAENGDCLEVYSVHGDTATFSFSGGVIALEYYSLLKDSDGNILIPEYPDMLWSYMGRYAEMEHWRNRLGEQGAAQAYQLAKMETESFNKVAKSALLHMNMDSRIAREQIYGTQRFIKVPSVVRSYFNAGYFHGNRTLF
jgi:hypothetical protein